MDVYKAKIQSDGILDKLKLIILVRGDPHNKELVGDTWSQTDSIRNLKYFLVYANKHKARVQQLYFIESFLQNKLKNIVFVKLYSIFTDYFPEYLKYSGRAFDIIEFHVWHD